MYTFLNNGKRPASIDSTASLLNSKKLSISKYSIKRISLMTKESIASVSSQSVDVTGINIDDYETTSVSIALDGYDSYNAPEGIFNH